MDWILLIISLQTRDITQIPMTTEDACKKAATTYMEDVENSIFRIGEREYFTSCISNTETPNTEE